MNLSFADPEGMMHNLVLLVYKYDGTPQPVTLIHPHGNSKGSKPYRRVMESTKNRLASTLATNSPKDAVNAVFKEKGGLMNASSAGKLPRSREQAYYLKKKMQQKEMSASIGKEISEFSGADTRDMLYTVMLQCKMAEGDKCFVRDVTCAPEPMAVLGTNQQLFDLERFCCDPYKFCVLGVDPTFNLGQFSVTPMVYRHLLLEDTKSHKPPLVLGPLLVHHRKQFRTYNYFLSTLIGLRPGISTIQAVGTDGEKPLIDALARNFPYASQLRCFRHLQQNLEANLKDKHFPAKVVNEYIREVFGWADTDGTVHEGLVDSYTAEDFDQHLADIQPTWDCREAEAFSNLKDYSPVFHTWFTTNVADIYRNHTLRSLREDVGLGCPPMSYRTNDSESINAILKECVGYKKQKWAIFNEIIKKAVENQQREFEKSLVGLGQYSLQNQYSFLSVQEDKWFKMTTNQRLYHIKKFNECKVRVTADANERVGKAIVPSTNITDGAFELDTDRCLSISHEMALSACVPETVAEGIWRKATSLVFDVDAIVRAPGCGPKDKMVKSKSGVVPHLVTSKKEYEYACDEKCPQFKSSGICSHTVAAAEVNGELEDFVKLYRARRVKQPPNLTKLAKHGMPSGAGRKGGRPAKKKVSQSKHVLTDENRVPLQYSNCDIQFTGNVQSVHSSTGSTPATQYNIQVESSKPPQQVIQQHLPSVPWSFSPCGYLQPSVSPLEQLSLSPFGQQSSVSPFIQQPSVSPFGQPQFVSPYRLESPVSPYSSGYPMQNSLPVNSLNFKVCFKKGNISVCSGCRQSYGQVDEIVIQHEEFRSFTNPQTGLPAQKFGNSYYHCRVRCILLKWPNFSSHQLMIPSEVELHLSDFHKSLLQKEFGLQI